VSLTDGQIYIVAIKLTFSFFENSAFLHPSSLLILSAAHISQKYHRPMTVNLSVSIRMFRCSQTEIAGYWYVLLESDAYK